MPRMKINESGRSRFALAGALVVMIGAAPSGAGGEAAIDTARISLPPGFGIEVFATVPRPRSMAVAEELQAVFVGTGEDKVYAVIDRDRDRRADEVMVVARGLNGPAGVAFEDGHLFVATRDGVLSYVIDELRADGNYPVQRLKDGLPASEGYGARDAALGPDGKLYLSVGAPCDLCDVSGVEATILRMNTDGTGEEVFASGVRASAGMDFRIEESGQAAWYFTDDGVDNMGADSPPDELNHAWRAGLNFGFPWYGGAGVRTAEYENEAPPADAQMPVIRFPPHSAPMGIHFYRGEMFPRSYRGDLFVAEYGSPDRAGTAGPRVLRIRFDEDRPVSTRIFAEGWVQEGGPWGRPVDVAELGDGSLLISDGQAGVIYRVTYAGP